MSRELINAQEEKAREELIKESEINDQQIIDERDENLNKVDPIDKYESLNDKLPQTPPPSIWDIFGSSIKGIGKQDNAGAGAGAGAGTGVDSENTEESSETQDKGKGKSKGKRKELTIVRDVKDNMQPDRFEAHDCL